MPEEMLLALEQFVSLERSNGPSISMLELEAFRFDFEAATQNRLRRLDEIHAAIQRRTRINRDT